MDVLQEGAVPLELQQVDQFLTIVFDQRRAETTPCCLRYPAVDPVRTTSSITPAYADDQVPQGIKSSQVNIWH